MPRTWTCQRQTSGVKCRKSNPRRKQNCERCGKRRPPTKRPAHMAALDIPYESYVALNGGEHCGICGAGPGGKRLDRDHDHTTGKARGLLCNVCNRRLPQRLSIEWLQAALDYLQRSEESIWMT